MLICAVNCRDLHATALTTITPGTFTGLTLLAALCVHVCAHVPTCLRAHSCARRTITPNAINTIPANAFQGLATLTSLCVLLSRTTRLLNFITAVVCAET